MPTYQYACTECDHHFEQFQSFSDDSLTHCPACDGRLRKVFNAVGVVFKGSGFYRTDSRDSGGPGGTGSDTKKESTGGESSGEAKPAEKKTEAKAETKKSEGAPATSSPTPKATSGSSGS